MCGSMPGAGTSSGVSTSAKPAAAKKRRSAAYIVWRAVAADNCLRSGMGSRTLQRASSPEERLVRSRTTAFALAVLSSLLLVPACPRPAVVKPPVPPAAADEGLRDEVQKLSAEAEALLEAQ